MNMKELHGLTFEIDEIVENEDGSATIKAIMSEKMIHIMAQIGFESVMKDAVKNTLEEYGLDSEDDL